MFNRHNLVYMSGNGRKAALAYAKSIVPDAAQTTLRKLILSDVPAIIKRQEDCPENHIEVGFSAPLISDGVRFRVGTAIPENTVIQVLTPFDVYKRYEAPQRMAQPLNSLWLSAKNAGFHLGVYGSLAMEMATGLPYLHERSDIDIYIKAAVSSPDYYAFYAQMRDIERKFGIAVDCEFEYNDFYGIKLKELFAGQKRVLAKGFNGVFLIGTSQIIGVVPVA